MLYTDKNENILLKYKLFIKFWLSSKRLNIGINEAKVITSKIDIIIIKP